MSSRYSLLDDEDNLGSLLEPNTLQSLQPSAAEMAPSPAQGAYNQTTNPPAVMPDLHRRDPEVEEAWRGLELQKINEARQGSDYGLGEAARDVIPTGLALALDAALNKGRGAANVLQGGMTEVGNQELMRRKDRQAAGELAVKLHGKNDELGWQRAMTAQMNAGTGLQRVNNTQQRFNDQGNPESDYSRGKVTQGGRLASATTDARIRKEDELNPIVAGDKAAVRTAETEAEIAARHGQAPIIAQDAADKSALEAEASTTARMGAEHAGAEVANADRAAGAGAVAAAQLPSQKALKVTETPGDVRAAAGQTAQQADQYTKETGYDRGMASQLDRLDRVISKYPEGQRALPGVGVGTGFGGEANDTVRGLLTDFGISDQTDALEMSSARKTLAELAQRKESGAAGPEAEKARYAIRVGAQPNATEAQFRVAIKAARDLVHMNLSAAMTGKEGAARGVIKNAGLEGWLPQDGEGGGTQGGDVLPGAVGEAMPGSETLPADLGTTGGYRQRDVPPITAQPSGGGSLRYLRKPDGTVVPTMKSDAEIELLKTRGFQLVNK